MALFKWQRRLQAEDPQEPASPPPFKVTDRVVVTSSFEDGAFLDGYRGTVVGVQFTTDPDDPYGPWVIQVQVDGLRDLLKFHASELAREPEHEEPAEAPVVTVTQPEDTLAPWLQRAKELRYETVFPHTPVFDAVTAEALSRDGLAAEVESFLAEVADGGAA